MNTIYLDDFCLHSMPILFVGEYFIGWLASSFVIKSCIGMESVPKNGL